jgi:23S rRNA (cytosine1962-C5)-methyltransferase
LTLRPSPAKVILKEKRDAPFRRGHPWVFSGAVGRLEGAPAPAAEVAVLSHQGHFIAWGLYNPRSQIQVRLYSWKEEEPISKELLCKRLAQALALRRSLPVPFAGGKEEAARLVFSESDGLSGLVVDYYAGHLAVQLTALALSPRLEEIVGLLNELLHPESIYLRTEKGIRELEGLEIEDKPLWGKPPETPLLIRENGLLFEISLAEGHKTGFYLDQRENRKRAAEFAQGLRCLDVCCYTGGFSLNLAHGGARSVQGIDASASAVAAAERNARRNNLPGVKFTKGDAFVELERLAERGERYDLIVLDPPRFAQSTQGLSQALKGYAGLNGLCVRLLEPGGLLFTCSCSGRVGREEFRGVLAEVAQKSGRFIRILEERGAAPDHPINVACPESAYLKCFICRVE